jgi:hypothetical protein
MPGGRELGTALRHYRAGRFAAWAVGILIGGIAPYTPGSQCPNQWWAVDCTANFTFNNIDYAIGGLPGYAMYYAS